MSRFLLTLILVLCILSDSLQASGKAGSELRSRRIARRRYRIHAGYREADADAVARKWMQTGELSVSEYPITLVTALYDIKRGTQGDGRSIEQYMQWMQEMLQMKGPMVVYVGTEEHAGFVARHRQGQPTHIITRPLNRLMFYKLRHLVEANQKSDTWRNCIHDPERMENKVPLYIVLNFSKFEFMNEVSLVNPYGSKYFFWIDAGISRLQHWTGNLTLTTGTPWPNITRVQQLDPTGNKLLVPLSSKEDGDYSLPKDLFKYFCGEGDGFLATLFGGTGPAFQRVLKDAENFLYHELLPMGAVANEQMFFFVWNARNNSRMFPIPEPAMWYEYLS